MLARDPFAFDDACSLARGQSQVFPTGNAALEIGCADPGAAQRTRHAPAGGAGVSAVGHHGAAGRQVQPPMLDIRGGTMDSADDQPVVGGKGVLPADVEQHRR